MTDIMTERFCEDGKTPSLSDVLQNGRELSVDKNGERDLVLKTWVEK